MKRVMIIGGSGSGKSTLARMLGEVTGLPVVHIDPMFWRPGWEQRPMDETHALVREATACDSWIFEGNNSSTFAERMVRADTLIFLDMPTYLRLWRVIRRTIKDYGKVRIGSGEGCPERFNWEFLTKWVLQYNTMGRPRVLQALENTPEHLQVHRLTSRGEVRRFLAGAASNG